MKRVIPYGPYKGRLIIPANHSYDDPEGTIRGGPYGYGAHVLYSDDHGKTWSEIDHDYQLVESRCQAGILNIGQFSEKTLYLFSNPAVPVGRTALTIKVSFDDCKSWSNAKLVYAGPSTYSCLVKLPNNQMGVFFEMGEKQPYEKMVFVSFELKELFAPETILNKPNNKKTN